MTIELREDDVDAFFEVPFIVYGEGSPYVSPLKGDLERALDPARNPLFGSIGGGTRHVLTAHRDGKLAGRIVAHVHGASNVRHKERRCSFGYFDCINDIDVARALLGAAEQFAKQQGCDRLEGSFNLTAMQQMGVVTEGFDAIPYLDMVWNPAYIPQLLSQCGFAPTFPMRTYELDLRRFDPDVLLHGVIAEVARDPTLEWAELRTRDFKGVLEQVRLVLNNGFEHNPMFVPLTSEEILFQAADLSHVMDPRITVLVREAATPVGVILCVPDLNPLFRAMRSKLGLRSIMPFLRFRFGTRTRALVIFASVVQPWQGKGLNGAMMHRMITALKKAGYEQLGITWIGDMNTASIRQTERLGAKQMQRLHLFTKAIV